MAIYKNLYLVFSLEIVTFDSYVGLPEGTLSAGNEDPQVIVETNSPYSDVRRLKTKEFLKVQASDTYIVACGSLSEGVLSR